MLLTAKQPMQRSVLLGTTPYINADTIAHMVKRIVAATFLYHCENTVFSKVTIADIVSLLFSLFWDYIYTAKFVVPNN